MKCDKCGYDDRGTGDWAHVCSSGRYAPQTAPRQEPSNLVKMWADPRFQILADMDRLLENNKIWNGMGWDYVPISPVKYRPVAVKVRQALDALQEEYGIKQT